MKHETKEAPKATDKTKKDEPQPITKASEKKQTAESVKGTTKTDSGATSSPEQLGEKPHGVDPSSQAINQGETKLNDNSAPGGYNTIQE
jgi:hypothetical protein